MIRDYNRRQLIQAVLLAVGGLACCLLAFCFFGLVLPFAVEEIGYKVPVVFQCLLGLAGVAACFVTGYKAWRDKGGLYGFHQSSLYLNLEESTASAFVMNLEITRVTGTAHVLSQVFLAGPLWLLKAYSLHKGRIPEDPALEERLVATLNKIKRASKWQGLQDYPGQREEVLYLAQMGLIDFSAFKGTPRFKIC